FYEPLATEFRVAADHWLKIAEKQLREAQAVVEKEPAPQVFRAGDPVDREKEAFVPRDSVVGNMERQVMWNSTLRAPSCWQIHCPAESVRVFTVHSAYREHFHAAHRGIYFYQP